MSVDIEARVRRANPLTHTGQLEQLFGEDTSSRLFRDIHHKREGRMPDTTGNQQPTNVQDRTTATRQKTEPRTPSPGPSRRRGLLVAAAALVVAITPVTSYEDIAGTYRNDGGAYYFALHIFEDGTWHVSTQGPLLVEDYPQEAYETRFEATKVFVTETQGDCGDDTEAIYEIGRLENGNLQFVPIEDTCVTRSRTMRIAEFEPFLINP